MTEKTLKTLIILFKTSQNLDKHIKKSLISTSLTVNEFVVLEALYNKGNLSVGDVLNYVLIPNSSMTYVVNSLTKKGYVKQYAKSDDQRIKLLEITTLGRKLFLDAYEKHYAHIRKQLDVLTHEEEAELQHLLKKLGYSLERNL